MSAQAVYRVLQIELSGRPRGGYTDGVVPLPDNKPGTRTRAMLTPTLLLPLRIFMGVTFLYAGIQHLTDPTYFDPSKPGYIGHLISQYAVGSPIHDFLLGVAQPNATGFGYLVATGEALIGIAILLGFIFRVAALAGLLLNFVFFLSATWNAFPFYFGSDIVFVICWLTLLITGPQPGLSLDSILAQRSPALAWLAPKATEQMSMMTATELPPPRLKQVQLPASAKLYPKQVFEVNRAFERIDRQFVAHEETQTILELVRAFVISLGVDRTESAKILSGLQNIVSRDAWEQRE